MRNLQSLPPASRESLLEQVKAEQAKRRKLVSARFTKYQQDPVGFVQNVLLGFLWSKQREICESVRDNRFTAVKSCHDVGKSAVAARIIAWWLSVWEPGEAFVVTSAPTFNQVKGILWREINQVHRAGGLPGRCNQTEWVIDHPGGTSEIVGFGRAVRDTDPTALQGIHARRVLVVFDEACGMGAALTDAAETLVANEESRFLQIGNPDDPSSEFARSCKPGSIYKVIRISAFDSPNFTGEKVPAWLKPLLVSKTWVAERKKKWGEASPLYISKVTGEFPDQATDGLIPLSKLNAAQNNEYEPKPGDPNELGVDIARLGLDSSVIYHRHGNRARVVERLHKRDLMTVCGAVVRAIKATGATVIKIDDTGLGGGVTDRLRELKFEGTLPSNIEIIAINVGEKCRDLGQVERFFNLRAQVNWLMRERFMDELIDLDPEEDDLLGQIGEIKYKPMSNGQIAIESKIDMKKRTAGVSPDDWDALVLAFTPKELGSTMTHTAVASDLMVKHFDAPKQWPRICAIHFDRKFFGAIWGAVDREANVIYLYAEYLAPLTDLSIHANAVRQRGKWIPVLWNAEAAGRKASEGVKLTDRLVDLELNLFLDETERDAAVADSERMFSAGRVKVSELCSNWEAQFAASRRSSAGEIIGGGEDHLKQASELLLSSGFTTAAFDPVAVDEAKDSYARETRDPRTGY
jgi:hypothetical protein